MVNNFNVLISFSIYLLLMLLIGFYYYRKTSNTSDYFLAGRKLNKWVAAISAQASDMSGWLLMGLPGYAYAAGLEASWIAIGLALGTFLNWLLVAKPLRIETERYGEAITLPQFFENRFNDQKHVIRLVSSIFILIFFTIYTASGFVAGAKLFNSVFGVSYHYSLFIAVGIIIVYTFLGGFNAVSWTDLIQGTLMFIAIVAVPLVGVIKHAHFGSVLQELQNIESGFLSLSVKGAGTVGGIVIASNLAWGLGYFGQPHILARFMAIESPEKIAFSRKVAMFWVVISLFFAVVVGMVGRLMFSVGLNDPEGVFMKMVYELFNPWVGGVFLAAILAAVMSTADSQLLVASSAITEDILKLFRNVQLSQRKLIFISRWAVVLIALVGIVVAWNPENKVLDLVAYAWGGFGATFGPVILLSLYWKKMNKFGVLAAIITGGIVVLVWKQLSGGIFDLYEIVPGFMAALLAGVGVSLFKR